MIGSMVRINGLVITYVEIRFLLGVITQLGFQWLGSMGYNLLINAVYWH